MAEYIERENLLDGISSPESGFDDTIENLIFEHNLDFLHYNDEDEVRAFAKELIGKVKNYISTEPTADVVEVVHGEWVETYQPLGFDEVKCAECSSCGEDWIMDDDVCIDDYKAHWKYCPCCGAKMDGKENGNNGN